jgi:hypothetical protein
MMSPADIGASVNESNEFMPNVPIPDRAHLTLFCARLKNGFANISAFDLERIPCQTIFVEPQRFARSKRKFIMAEVLLGQSSG